MRAALIAFTAGSLMATAASAAPVVLSSPAKLKAAPSPPADPPAKTPGDQSTTVSGIVVEARTKQQLQAFAAAVDTFVRAQGRPSPVHQLTRWTRPVCPQTFGMKPEFNAFVSQRIKTVADRVGATAPGKCRGTNVMVLFTTQPDDLVADVRDHHPGLLGSQIRGDPAVLAHFHPPMTSWYVSMTAASAYYTTNKDTPDDVTLDNSYGMEQPECTRMRECEYSGAKSMKSEFAFALIIVEADRIVGKPIGAVADEVAMTVLSRAATRDGCSALPSVMDVLDLACPVSAAVDGLTAYDTAYLKALYTPRDSQALPYDRTMIARAVQAVGLHADQPAAEDGPPASSQAALSPGTGTPPPAQPQTP